MTEVEMTGSGSDRRGFMKGAAVTAAAVGAGALGSGTAAAQPIPDTGLGSLGQILGGLIPLPPIGVDIPCSCYGANVPLKINILGALTLDFKGGINVCIRTSTPEGIIVEIQGHRVEADTSPSTPNSGTLIAITMSNATLTPLSVLEALGSGGLQMLIYLSLTVEIIDKATGETIGMFSTDPSKYATLKATDVKAFPPVNQLYTLQEPVTLYPMGGSEAAGTEPAGVLEGFDVIVNQSEA
ncbi:twin-arginine translocation signal domain-containing protein [Streptomyces polyrhachis]|uniref:Twin-arginine translocation signal domain-containing protein n=1 Tax=Streptomyces polyrhachis TaxID=1282885 RepID=A0ABW2GJM1_9ACTN